MTEPTSLPATQSDEPEQLQQPMRHDWVLQLLVSQANRFGIEIGVTLHVGGMLVSGTLIGQKTYFALLSELFKSATGNKAIAESYANAFVEAGEPFPGDPAADNDGDDDPPPNFIHLRNLRFMAPGQPTTNVDSKVVWRGRITCVAGWYFGSAQ